MAENNNPQGGEQVILNVDLNTSGAQQSIAQLTKSFDQLTDELNHYKDLQKSAMNPADMAKYNQEIARIKTEMQAVNTAGLESANSVKGFKQQLREATQAVLTLANEGKKNTEQYRQAVIELARLRDLSGEVNRDILANDPGNRFQALAKGASLLGNSFAGVTGALSLMGLEAENASEVTARLTAIESIVGMIDTVGDLGDYYAALKLKIFGGVVAREAETVATVTQTIATEGQIVATEGATLATKGLGLAFKAIGIGLIIGAIAYLITNWDSLKKSVTDAIPALKDTGAQFDKLKQIVFGVGNVILQYIVAPIKALIKVVQGDFKGAMNEMKKGFDVVGNYQTGVANQAAAQAETRRKEALEKLIKDTDNRIAILKARGRNTEALEREQFRRKMKLAQDDEKEFAKLKQDSAVFEATQEKIREDKAKAEADKIRAKKQEEENKRLAKLKAETNEYKKFVDDANKVIAGGTQNERDRAITDLEFKYKKEIELATKLGQSTVELEQAKALEIKNINIKYIDEVNTYLASKDAEKMTSFDKQRKQVNDELEKLLKNAPKEEIDKLNASRASQLGVIDNLENASNLSTQSDSALKQANLVNAKDDSDGVTIARIKIENIRNAEITAELAAFNLAKLQKEGQLSELEQLERDHNDRLLNIESEASKAKIELSQKEKEAKIANLQTVGSALGGLASLVAETTSVGKGISIAQATIDTYVGATKALAQGGIFGYIGAAGIISTGFANIRKITNTKIPNANGSSSGAPSFQAPVINSTILNQNNNGVGGLRSDLVSSKESKEPLKAYIVDSDLNKQKDKTDLYNRLSSI